MIIPALIDYYDRLQEDPDSDIAPFGFSRQLVSFEVVLSEGGAKAEIRDARLPGDDRPMLRSLSGFVCVLIGNFMFAMGFIRQVQWL